MTLMQACFECAGQGRSKDGWFCKKCIGKGEHEADCNQCGEPASVFEDREYLCDDCMAFHELQEYGECDREYEEAP